MNDLPRRITLVEWDERYARLRAAGLREPEYGGPLGRHVDDGDLRLLSLRMDNSAAALRLWNFLLTEEDRLRRAVAEGKKLVGTMKDLGTVPVMACCWPNLVAFYPDGAWWIPCIEQQKAGLLQIADRLGIDESFCPVRAMLGAFVDGDHFPIPGLLTCSVGATCDDFSAIAQRLEGLGFPILWWEVPHRRRPEPDEPGVTLPGGFLAPQSQIDFVKRELQRIREALDVYAGEPTRIGEGTSGGLSRFSSDENGTVPLGSATVVSSPVLSHLRKGTVPFSSDENRDSPQHENRDSPQHENRDSPHVVAILSDERLAAGIARANQVRRCLGELREMVFRAPACPLPALEMLIAEMLAIHFCSDQDESLRVLEELRTEVASRVRSGVGVLPPHAVRVFWVNPVADLRVMNLLEDAGARICGTEYLFCHAIAPIPEDLPPMEALARMVLADPMVGSPLDRAEWVAAEVHRLQAEALVVSRIPGASHCAWEGTILGDSVRQQTGVPVLEIEVPPISDSIEPTLRTRLEALVETAMQRRENVMLKHNLHAT